MSVIYLISVLGLFITTFFIKKSDKKFDVVKSIAIIMVLFLCYQTFVSYLYTMLHIPITLLLLSVINTIVIAILVGRMIHKKEVQQYQFDLRDLIFITILILVVFFISYCDFGMPWNIKYLTTDSAIHYISTREFYENESLLLTVDNIKSSNAMMPGAYSNIGILFKTFAPWIGEMNLYKVFIGFDIFALFLSGMMFFVTIKKYVKTTLTYFIAGALSIIYLLGYPLNNMLFGYFYLGIGVLAINAIVAIMQDWKEEAKLNTWYIMPTVFLLCFELFFSYYLFVPPIYGAIFIYYLFYFHKQKGKWINSKIITYSIITLIVPAIMGFCYHVLPGLLSSDQIQVGNVIQTEGYIYRNLFSNILLFIPFMLYYLAKEKKIQFDIISIILWILYMCVLYISVFKLNISTYYFFKTYFVLWQFAICLTFKGIYYLVEEKKYGKILASAYIGFYILLMIHSFLTSNVPVIKDTFNKNEKITDVMDIFGINKTVLLRVGTDYTVEELEILNYVKENNIELKNNNALILADQRQEFWFWAILKYQFKTNLEYATTKDHIKLWNNDGYEYLIYFNRSNYYNSYRNALDLKDTEVIFENNSGAIIKNK